MKVTISKIFRLQRVNFVKKCVSGLIMNTYKNSTTSSSSGPGLKVAPRFLVDHCKEVQLESTIQGVSKRDAEVDLGDFLVVIQWQASSLDLVLQNSCGPFSIVTFWG